MIELDRLTEKKFLVLVGEFGSGKSELAINAAARERRILVDLDIAKPMNSSRDFRKFLAEKGVTVVGSPQCYDHLEMRVLPQMVPQVIQGDHPAVFDVGGGDSAVTIGQYSSSINEQLAEVLLVVNIFRPFSQTTSEIIDERNSLEARTGLEITGVVCNCNLAGGTDIEVATAGVEIMKEVAALTGLPLKLVVLPDWLRGTAVKLDYPVYYLQRYFNYIK